MSKVHKITLYVVDHQEDYSNGLDLVDDLERSLHCGCIGYWEHKQSESFEWDDSLPINFKGCSKATFEKYL